MADGDEIVREGRCLCGAVSYRVSGQPLRVGLCHCQDCRQSTGSAFSMFAVWPRSAWTGEGEMRTYSFRSFCPQCGSTIANISEAEAEVMVGTLDNGPSDLVPEYELWIPRREHWLATVRDAAQFNRDRHDDAGSLSRTKTG